MKFANQNFKIFTIRRSEFLKFCYGFWRKIFLIRTQNKNSKSNFRDVKHFLNYEFKILHLKFPRYTVRHISAEIKFASKIPTSQTQKHTAITS